MITTGWAMAFCFSVSLVCYGALAGPRYGVSSLTGAAVGFGCYVVLQVLYIVGEIGVDAIRRWRSRDGRP